MVDAALNATRATQSRLREICLPGSWSTYYWPPACFPKSGTPVWRKLTAGLTGIPTATPTSGGLATARRRIGVAPVRRLFDLLRGPAATGTVMPFR
jgi:hypothetical protein